MPTLRARYTANKPRKQALELMKSAITLNEQGKCIAPPGVRFYNPPGRQRFD